MKTIAMYLPQFHRTKENDKWWGDGYTDWTAVRKCKSLFSEHDQPKVPLNNNYYDLLDKSTMKWQAELMHRYGIDALCMYHYYFENGQKALEKPAENLLEWKDIDIPFCFCWDTGNWARTWSNVGGNAWNPILENTVVGKEDNGILIKQNIGWQDDWKKHYEYLKNFFRDDRYLKIYNKPVFCLYTHHFWQFRAMVDYWNDIAKEDGFDGVYIISFDINAPYWGADAIVAHAPHSFWKKKEITPVNGVKHADFDTIWQSIVCQPCNCEIETYYEGFMGYDDTPRRGNYDGMVVDNSTTDKFKNYMQKLFERSYSENKSFVFFNAWNEWGEGMYLEPDEKNKYQYLEAFKEAHEMSKSHNDSIQNYNTQNDNTSICNDWVRNEKSYYREYLVSKGQAACYEGMLELSEKNISMKRFFSQNNINHIAVYGIGKVGKSILSYLENDVVVDYLIDRNTKKYKNYDVIGLEDEWPSVDAIIVTAVGYFDDIYPIIRKKTLTRVYLLNEVLNFCLRQ